MTRLFLENDEQIVGTPRHRTWCLNRQQFIGLSEFVAGDEVESYNGPVKVICVETTAEPIQQVFNLEIAGQHVYRIGKSGCLVHNVGDCVNAPNRGLPILNPNFTPKPTTLGKVGETLAGLSGNKTKILINGRNRIPDGLDDVAKRLIEVKNVKSQSFTRQLRDFSDYAKQNGFTFELFVRPDTKLSGPLLEAIRNGDIILRNIPGI